MQSDATPPRPAAPGFPPSPARSSNLKSRWRRGPAAGLPKPAAVRAAAVGAVTDLASARESLSGPLARGPAEAPPPPPAPLAPVREEPPPPVAQTVPEPVAPPSAPPPPPRVFTPPPDADGDRHRPFISLRPDPANDPAPRRLRTDAPFTLPPPAPPAVVEYSPSRAPRRPHASIPIKTGRSGSDSAARKPAAASRAHATIPADVDTARGETDAAPPAASAPAAPGGSILGKIKRFFGFGGDSTHLLAPHHGESQYEKRQAARAHTGAPGENALAAGAHRRRRRRGGRRHRARRESEGAAPAAQP